MISGIVIALLLITGGILAVGAIQKGTQQKTIEKIESTPLGASNAEIVYADKDKAIIHTHVGLIVFEFSKAKISTALDLAELEVWQQGSEACTIFASEHGNNLYFEMSNGKLDYIYHVDKKKLVDLTAKNEYVEVTFDEGVGKLISTEGSLTLHEELFNAHVLGNETEMKKILDSHNETLTPHSNVVKINSDIYVFLARATPDGNDEMLKDLEIVKVSAEEIKKVAMFH